MNNQMINASAFKYNIIYFNSEFENILRGIISCYHSMVSAKIKLPHNNEGAIRDAMLSKNYLKGHSFKENHPQLLNYHFDKETTENNGRADIRILHVNPYKGDEAYYIIECKRLDGENKLNREYIGNGIARFTNEKKYPFYENIAGMIGFVVKKIDIHKNTHCNINELLQNVFTKINTERILTKKEINPDFEYSYYSSHKIDGDSKIIYHLMFDFSDNITL